MLSSTVIFAVNSFTLVSDILQPNHVGNLLGI